MMRRLILSLAGIYVLLPGKEKRFGLFSQKATDAGYPVSVWLTVDNRTVEVTAIAEADEDIEKYPWPDKYIVGELKEFVRRGRLKRS
ncbi:MAG: hypothetical protein IT162_08895 [Bryobacterales bacterium]|nr:hypothetical protein [Bryobacterales bacterium]